jgi:phosphopantothenoylcysteine synthetase/decarboxylase
LGHSDIAYNSTCGLLDRKQDPSHLFDWEILAKNNIGLYPKLFMVGFAAETESDLKNLLALGKGKLSAKGLDLLYVNDVSHGQVFGSDETSGFLIARDGNVIDVPNISKDTLSEKLLDQLSIALG